MDDTTVGEETRESAKRERVLCKLVPVWIGHATLFGVKLWSRQAARIEAQRIEVYMGRMDIRAVDSVRRVFIGERARPQNCLTCPLLSQTCPPKRVNVIFDIFATKNA